MKKEDLIFPLTAEAYIAYQEAGAGLGVWQEHARGHRSMAARIQRLL